VAIVTYERPTFVARCIDHLLVQTCPPKEIIVVDSSTSDDTARVVRDRYPMVTYAVCTAGRGATAVARGISHSMASGEVLAFIDDDAFAEPEWLEKLLPHFEDPTVGGVGGRQIRRQAGELEEGVDAIGRLEPDGTITGNFAADPGRTVSVDHLLGANMSFRRSSVGTWWRRLGVRSPSSARGCRRRRAGLGGTTPPGRRRLPAAGFPGQPW
jgi:GT2 family glycosyltransferase